MPSYFDVAQAHLVIRAPDFVRNPVVADYFASSGSLVSPSRKTFMATHNDARAGASLQLQIVPSKARFNSVDYEQMSKTLFTVILAAMSIRMNVEKEKQTNQEYLTRELHDSVAQQLGYLSLTTASLQKACERQSAERSLALVAEVRSGLEQVQRQIRELIAGTRLTLEEPTLSLALEASLREYGRRSSILFELDNRLVEGALSSDVTLQILQIIREGLANIVRHSHARSARISLVQVDRHVEVCIEDDGIGFDGDGSRDHHYGMAIMRERARSIDARLEVVSGQGRGTKLEITLPIGIG